MRQSFWVPGPFPGMNEIIAAAKSGHGRGNAYSRQKALWTTLVARHAKKGRMGEFTRPVAVECVWAEPHARRDVDNVAAAVKFVLDGLVVAGVLEGDSRKHVLSVSHTVVTNANYPGVTVTVSAMEEE